MIPSVPSSAAFDQARFAAREFVARFEREMGGDCTEVVRERMLFAFEMGYLRGRSSAMQGMIDDLARSGGG